MFNLTNYFESSDDDEDVVDMTILRKSLRNRSNPLELPNNEYV